MSNALDDIRDLLRSTDEVKAVLEATLIPSSSNSEPEGHEAAGNRRILAVISHKDDWDLIEEGWYVVNSLEYKNLDVLYLICEQCLRLQTQVYWQCKARGDWYPARSAYLWQFCDCDEPNEEKYAGTWQRFDPAPNRILALW